MQSLLNKTASVIFLTAGLMTLGACAPESGPGQFYREAGSQLDTGEFGNSTLHNQLVQTCKKSASGKIGGSAGDPVVVLDPSSTPSRKVYRVHCDGKLDGKYAQVVYSEYVGSAVQVPNVQQADAE